MKNTLTILSGNANRALSESICEILDVPLIPSSCVQKAIIDNFSFFFYFHSTPPQSTASFIFCILIFTKT